MASSLPPQTGQPPDIAFRGAMRRRASSVAIVATPDGKGQPRGTAMTAFRCEPLVERGRCSVNIRREDAAACHAFVPAPAHERFFALDWEGDEGGGFPSSCPLWQTSAVVSIRRSRLAVT